MRNKISKLLILLGLLPSCNNKVKNESKPESDSGIIITDKQGNKISKENFASSTGTFNYEIYGIENVSDLAKSLHSQARQYGQKGNYKKAIENLEKANKEAPNWAYPLYDLAYTYLLQDDYDNALKYYKLTDKVAPKGFYTSKVALHTLERENRGDLQKGVYKYYLAIEWTENQVEKSEIIHLLIKKFPSFAPVWKDYSSLLKGQERLDAILKGLELKPDIETKGMLLINKALAINESGNKKKASEILINVISDTNSTYGNIELAKFVLHNISNKR